MQQLKIHFFKAYSKEAKILSCLVQKEIPLFTNQKLGIESIVVVEDSKGLLPENDKQPSAFNVLQAALNNEIVIIDASIEKIEGIELGVNYECITPAVSSLDNIMVVSRTELPLNFIPCRSNVAALGQPDLTDNRSIDNAFDESISIDEQYLPNNDLTTYKQEYSNEYIIAWIKSTLFKMKSNGRLIRKHLPSIDVSNSSGDLFEREMEIMKENMETIQKEKGNKKKVFVSYRSVYYPKKDGTGKKYNGKYDVKDIVKIINNKHQREGSLENWEEPFLYPSGVLSNELMPEIRRWAFVAMPDREIRESDEFWIFETKHKTNDKGEIEEYGYWDSWWCLGEFITIVRMKHSDQLKDNFKLIIYDPDTDEVNEIPHEEIPTMTDEQNRELARYFANGDFLEAGYESMGNMREMRKKPKWLRWVFFQLLKKYVWPKVMSPEDIKDFKFKYYNDSVKSHVYDDNFMSDRILVDKEQERGLSRHDVFCDKDLVWKFLNINGCYTKSKNIPTYPGSRIINDNSELRETDKHFCLLWTPRMGKRTGPNGQIIEIVPLYEKA